MKNVIEREKSWKEVKQNTKELYTRGTFANRFWIFYLYNTWASDCRTYQSHSNTNIEQRVEHELQNITYLNWQELYYKKEKRIKKDTKDDRDERERQTFVHS